PYGGTGAVPLAEQLSDRFLTAEMDQLAVMARILPPAFLGVAAFLLWVTTGRLIATERERIGLLKAFGYRDREIALHYAFFALLVALLGVGLGILGGRALGRGVTSVYAEFYQFPMLIFRSDPATLVEAATLALLAALAGVVAPVRRVAKLAPAIAMQPPAPPRYRGWLSQAVGALRRLDEPARMVLRHLLRYPVRTLISATGVALALALAISTSFNTDAVARMIEIVFHQANRQTATIAFADVRPAHVTADLARLPGVLAVEPFRTAPARLSHGQRTVREALTGLAPGGTLVRPLDADGNPVPLPAQGLILSQTLAERLDARVGSILSVQVLDGAQPALELRVAGIVQTYQGTPAWIDLAALNALLLEGPVISGAFALVDRSKEQALARAVADLPMVAALTLRSAVIGTFEEQVAENLGIFRFYSLALAALIVVGVVYTNARMALAEQARDLATMRVLGYRGGEVATILIGNLLLVTLIGIPFGIALGALLSVWIAAAFSSDMYTIPWALSSATVGLAALTTLGAALAASAFVALDVRRLDLVGTLKAPE
ncbi:MAG: FtsX-like permease family protein, partial [Sphingomonadaceae bacterium]